MWKEADLQTITAHGVSGVCERCGLIHSGATRSLCVLAFKHCQALDLNLRLCSLSLSFGVIFQVALFSFFSNSSIVDLQCYIVNCFLNVSKCF